MRESTDAGRGADAAAKPLAPEAKPERGPEQEKLAAFIGDWRGEGRGGGGPAKIAETYDWVEGRFFIEGRFDQDFNGMRHAGVLLIGKDPEGPGHFLKMVDNLGYARDYRLTEDGDGAWTLDGERERARYEFDGDRARVRWEHRPGGKDWQELCAYELARGGRAH